MVRRAPFGALSLLIVALTTPAGAQTFQEFPVGRFPSEITTGPEGNLWFTEQGANRIGRLTVGGVYTAFTVPTPDSNPFAITSGPDGALWFTEIGAKKIGRLTTTGAFTEFPIPQDFARTPFGI